jgi:hypothetical protein
LPGKIISLNLSFHFSYRNHSILRNHSAKFKSNPFLLKEEHIMEQAEIEASLEAFAPDQQLV